MEVFANMAPSEFCQVWEGESLTGFEIGIIQLGIMENRIETAITGLGPNAGLPLLLLNPKP